MNFKPESLRAVVQFISGLLLITLAHQSYAHNGVCFESVFYSLFGLTHTACSFKDCSLCRMFSCYIATTAFLWASFYEVTHNNLEQALALLTVGVVLDFVAQEEKQRTKDRYSELRATKRHSTAI